jgi:hypothetical protein
MDKQIPDAKESRVAETGKDETKDAAQENANLDEALRESFPASDPVSNVGTMIPGGPRRRQSSR